MLITDEFHSERFWFLFLIASYGALSNPDPNCGVKIIDDNSKYFEPKPNPVTYYMDNSLLSPMTKIYLALILNTFE